VTSGEQEVRVDRQDTPGVGGRPGDNRGACGRRPWGKWICYALVVEAAGFDEPLDEPALSLAAAAVPDPLPAPLFVDEVEAPLDEESDFDSDVDDESDFGAVPLPPGEDSDPPERESVR
jgi:hypothetical protein